MDTRAIRFLRQWAGAAVLIAVLLAIFNYVMDPYLLTAMPRISRLNAHKPAADTQQRLMKAHEVVRAKSGALLLGSSRVALGINAQHPLLLRQGRGSYNLGIPAGGPYVAYRYLQ